MTTTEIYSIILAILAAGAAGFVGAFALIKRTVLAGDVMSHIALPGLGAALLFKINPLVGAAATLLLGIVIIARLEKKTGLSADVAIGVIFAASVALGALITPREDLIDALFGGFGGVNFSGFLAGLVLSIFVIAALLALKDKLIIALFSPELAASLGLNLGRLNLYYLLIFGAAILLGLHFLGAILVGALIIVPAAIGRRLTHNFAGFLALSTLAAVASTFLGLALSARYGLQLGPAVILSATALFVLSLLKKHT